MRGIICGLLFACVLFHFGAWAFDKQAGPARVAIQDAEGWVWAIRGEAMLSHWDPAARQWREEFLTGGAVIPGDAQAGPAMKPLNDTGATRPWRPVSLTSGAKGVVTCLWWSSEKDPMFVTSHLGAESKALGLTPPDAPTISDMTLSLCLGNPFSMGGTLNPLCYMDSKSNVWLSPDFKSLYLLTPDGTMSKVYDLPVKTPEFLAAKMPDGGAQLMNGPVYAQNDAWEDQRGRIIFYGGAFGAFVIEGIVVCDNGVFTHIPKLGGMISFSEAIGAPAGNGCVGIRKLEARDEKTSWLMPFAGMLSILDMDTFNAIPSEPPGIIAMESQALLSRQDNTLIASGASGYWIYDKDAWRNIITGVNEKSFTGAMHMSAAKWDGGLAYAAGTEGFGVASLEGGAARMYGWRQGFPLTGVSDVFALPGDQLLVLGKEGAVQISLAELEEIPSGSPLPAGETTAPPGAPDAIKGCRPEPGV